ncbi:MAG: hypothetical protein SYC29_12440 [Planctomycetota bacterium]|nr:hypothetical protein [Planctomycetota bacterium]
MTAILAYIPLLDPIPVFHDWWFLLLIPLALGISVIYKAMRVPDLREFWRQVAVMTTLIVLAMIAGAILLTIFVRVLIPLIPVE